MATYARELASDGADAMGVARTRATLLDVLDLRHSADWALAAPFIRAGGLASLAHVLLHRLPVPVPVGATLRGAAMCVLFQLTTHPAFEVDAETPTDDTTTTTTRELGAAMLAVDGAAAAATPERAGCRPFAVSLLTTWRCGAAAAGDKYAALHLAAFWLSWLRKVVLRGSGLQLAAEELAVLREWGATAPTVAAAGAAAGEVEDGEADAARLAQQLHDDFVRWGPAGVTGEEAAALAAARAHAAMPGEDAAASAPPPAVPTTAPTTAIGWKVAGNGAFHKGQYKAAAAAYSEGLDVAAGGDDAEVVAVLHNNRAAAYLHYVGCATSDALPPLELRTAVAPLFAARVAAAPVGSAFGASLTRAAHAALLTALPLVPPPASSAAAQLPAELAVDVLMAVVSDCDASLAAEPAARPNPKALFRKAQALAGLGRLEEAITVGRAARAACDTQLAALAPSSKDAGVAGSQLLLATNLLTTLTALREASVVSRATAPSGTAGGSATPPTPARVDDILAALPARRAAAAHTHAPPAISPPAAPLAPRQAADFPEAIEPARVPAAAPPPVAATPPTTAAAAAPARPPPPQATPAPAAPAPARSAPAAALVGSAAAFAFGSAAAVAPSRARPTGGGGGGGGKSSAANLAALLR